MNGPALKLQGGYGYWETDAYPVGGFFRRVGNDGKDIVEVIRTFPNYKGVDTEVRFADGTRGAVASAHIERQAGGRMSQTSIENRGGLRAVSEFDTLPDLCHHAEYRIHVNNGRYVENVGNLGRNAQRVFQFYQRRRRGKPVEVRPLACQPGCTWGQS